MVSDMNSLFVIGKDNPYPLALVGNVRPIEYRHDLIGTGASLSLGLDALDEKTRAEHRYYQRFRLNEDAFALIRSTSSGPLKIKGKSMGGIACAVFNVRPARLGKIDNISMGGLLFQHVDSKAQLTNEFVLDILLADCGFYLTDMPYKIISDVLLSEDVPGEPIEMRRVRLQFQNLSAYQQARLKDFIRNHGVEIGETGVNE
jgi:hypothetical protein